MANGTFSIYHSSALAGDTALAASGTAPGSSPAYVADSRLSYKFTTLGAQAVLEADQVDTEVRPFQYLILMDHNLTGGIFEITTYPTGARVTPTGVASGTVSVDDPFIYDVGSAINAQFIDVSFTTLSGIDISVGEVMLASKFDSPRGPSVLVPTRVVPRRQFIDMPNGERQSIRRGGNARIKSYTIPGLTLAQADSWIERFGENAGAELVVLEDERGDVYPAMMNQELSYERERNLVSLSLQFTEVPSR